MAFVVEDGTGIVGANSYVTVIYADDYFNIRGVSEWSPLTDKESLLIRATDYIDNYYGNTIVGEKLSETQSLEFPRIVNSKTIYPDKMLKAVCELALKSSSSTLLPDIERKTLKEKVDVITIEYDPNAPQLTQYSFIDNLMRDFISNSGGINTKTIRV